MKTKGPKQDSPNRLRSPMSEGGEPYEHNYCTRVFSIYQNIVVNSLTYIESISLFG